MNTLFEGSVLTISEYLSNLFTQNEIYKKATVRNFRIVQKEGSHEAARNIEFYNLDAVIRVGFRVNSTQAIPFRQWAKSDSYADIGGLRRGGVKFFL